MGLKQDLVQKRNELDAVNGKVKKIREECIDASNENEIDLMKSSTLTGEKSKDRLNEFRKMLKEQDGIGAEVDALAEAVKGMEREIPGDDDKDKKGGGVPHPEAKGQVKSLGQLFVESDGFKAAQEGRRNETFELKASPGEVKTLMTTAAGWAPESVRTGKVVLDAQRPIQVMDIVPDGDTNQAAIVYMEETTFTNNAAEVSEGGTYGEAALVLTERTSTVRKVGVWLPVTDEQLEDEAQVRSYIDQRLRFMLRQRIDGQLLVGDGNAPNLDGINNVSGIQTQAKGADPVPDAIYKAMTKIRVTGRAMPNVVVLHPNDWQGIRLLRTSDGIYIWGNPSESGVERIWGVPVAQADSQTENTGLVGDWANFCQKYWRRDIEVKITDAHSDYFIKGKQAIRADVRLAFVTYRPAAFCTVTGL